MGIGKHINYEEMKMKKLITILVIMMVLVGSVFATSGDNLIITSTVAAVPPQYVMRGSLSAYPTAAATATSTTDLADSDGLTLAGGSIAKGNIDVYVKVYQSNDATYLKTAGVSVKVTATDLAKDGTSATYKVTPSVAAKAGGQESATDDYDTTTATDVTGGVEFLPKYKTGAQVLANVVGTVQFHYAQNETLPAGDYSSTITLTYTAN